MTPQALKEREIVAITMFWGAENTSIEDINKEEARLTLEQRRQVEEVLRECQGVFGEQGATSQRGLDHKIPLKEGIDAGNVKPYRYFYVIKA